ncbi:MAG: hypothetical protein HY736_08880 [Verrucomicrobia bacterium]|nr:hypothetical protein [Verrucomicrobiota bacterium]
MKPLAGILAVCCWFSLLPARAADRAPSTLVDRICQEADATERKYVVHVPRDDTTSTAYPLVVFLHGSDGPRNQRGTQVVKLDLATGQRTLIGYGLGRPTFVSHDDRYLYGIWYPQASRSGDAWQPYEGEPKAARLAIREGAELEFLPSTWGSVTIPSSSTQGTS